MIPKMIINQTEEEKPSNNPTRLRTNPETKKRIPVATCLNCQTKVWDLSLLSPKGLCWHCHEAQKNPIASKFYGYGIVDKHNQPYWDDACVCQHSDPMEEVVLNLNDENYVGDTRRPYRVVKLVFEEL